MRWTGASMAGIVLVLAGSTASARDVGALTVTSSAFSAGGTIPSEYTCEGSSVSPPISWSAVPPDTKSVAVIVDDPDAPRGTYEHLVVFNLPPAERSLPSLSGMPATKGLAARNSGGTTGFAPICPPSGRHHYRFQVLALDSLLALPMGASSAEVANAIKGHVLARGELTGVYQKGRGQ
jgi:Raf kinase inhibitor-like YbhB/YbcL family protein